jgi:hypothetical protein
MAYAIAAKLRKAVVRRMIVLLEEFVLAFVIWPASASLLGGSKNYAKEPFFIRKRGVVEPYTNVHLCGRPTAISHI